MTLWPNDEAADDAPDDAARRKCRDLDGDRGVVGERFAVDREPRRGNLGVDGAHAKPELAVVGDRLDVLGGSEKLSTEDDVASAGTYRHAVEPHATRRVREHDHHLALVPARPDAGDLASAGQIFGDELFGGRDARAEELLVGCGGRAPAREGAERNFSVWYAAARAQ